MNRRTLALLAVGALVVVVGSVGALGVCVVLFRPDPWTIQTMRSDGIDRMYRVHRTDGRVEVMTTSGWKPVGRRFAMTPGPDPKSLPLLSCDEYSALKAKGGYATLNIDLFYRLPGDCPQTP